MAKILETEIRKLFLNNTSTMLTLPSEFCEEIGFEKSDQVVVALSRGKHGPFLAVWKRDDSRRDI